MHSRNHVSHPPTTNPFPAQAAEAPQVRHLAIIMDGNGRWAKSRGLSRSEGHRAGTAAARHVVEDCLQLGIAHLTLYTFSQENWKRPAEEVSFLFELLVDFISRELPSLEKRGVQMRVLGDMEKLPFTVKKTLNHAIARTRANTKMILNLALNYSGQAEIVRACQEFVLAGNDIALLTPEKLAEHLYTKGQPNPDLVIRTSGEMRTSNFLPFQTAYSEYYFTETLWPDFTTEDLQKALGSFASRQRRFGDVGTNESTAR